MIRRRRSSATA